MNLLQDPPNIIHSSNSPNDLFLELICYPKQTSRDQRFYTRDLIQYLVHTKISNVMLTLLLSDIIVLTRYKIFKNVRFGVIVLLLIELK